MPLRHRMIISVMHVYRWVIEIAEQPKSYRQGPRGLMIIGGKVSANHRGLDANFKLAVFLDKRIVNEDLEQFLQKELRIVAEVSET